MSQATSRDRDEVKVNRATIGGGDYYSADVWLQGNAGGEPDHVTPYFDRECDAHDAGVAWLHGRHKLQAKGLSAISVPCPCCGADEANIKVRLYDLDGDAFECGECDCSFSLPFVRTLLAHWAKVVAWVEQAPQFDE